MQSTVSGAIQVATATLAERRAAVAIALGYADDAPPEGIIDRAFADTAADAAVWEGLLVARRDKRAVGAAWVQFMAGGVATMSEPRAIAGESDAALVQLADAASVLMTDRGVVTGQALVESPRGAAATALRTAGFAHLTDLLYLTSTSRSLSSAREALTDRGVSTDRGASKSADLPVLFALTEYRLEDRSRLAALVEQTYIDTRDCPALNGVRQIDDVLAGYQATGVFAPERWLIAHRGDTDVGCLLLADHPADDQWELVYMGVAPSARGQRIGAALVEHAQYLTRAAGRQRLVVAVDAANEPALRMYARAGFEALLRRSVFLKRFEPRRDV
jgi:ribosomal protein S18 acetylase RimI-like enzyme